MFQPPTDFGSYMQNKTSKLADQFAAAATKTASESSLFAGVTFYVNGLTTPSHLDIKALVARHGGTFCHYYAPRQVTHVLCDALPAAKFAAFSKSAKIVRAAWLVDCIAAQRLLPCEMYELRRQPQHLTSHKATASPEGASFVAAYFKESRLHHLSQWRVELAEWTATLMAQKSTLPSSALLPASKEQRIVAHIDIDCFFASASALKAFGSLSEHVPIAVSHAASTLAGSASSSDVSSCNYAARDRGVRNGMHVGDALALCPDLRLLPYDFAAYRALAFKFYKVVSQYADCMEAVSCDEVFIDASSFFDAENVTEDNARSFAEAIQRQLKDLCGVNVSIGVAHNKLVARLCTRLAKPRGVRVSLSANEAFVAPFAVDDIPGVGRSYAKRLRELHIETCANLQACSVSFLQREFGINVGRSLYDKCRGIDDDEVKNVTQRKSISVDVNWGVRLSSWTEFEAFLGDVIAELECRLVQAAATASRFTLKLMISKDEHVPTAKYLGHGRCDDVSKAVCMARPVNNAAAIFAKVLQASRSLLVGRTLTGVRGVGVQADKLTIADATAAEARDRSPFSCSPTPQQPALRAANVQCAFDCIVACVLTGVTSPEHLLALIEAFLGVCTLRRLEAACELLRFLRRFCAPWIFDVAFAMATSLLHTTHPNASLCL